ncbi:hypothetical protein [Paenibacillus thermotolerans]|uniref:hypothetical protein n=1 Tax=Paenibacillus thermotolerans TaxID=3027807 RepID=UPI0023684BA3|nr:MULTISPECIES: hypothetical protein [unclassified Paenibacillus]
MKDRKMELMEKFDHTGDERALEEALQLFSEAVEKEPNNAENLFFYGWLLESRELGLL